VVQGALKLILEPIFEADFQPGSYGYRPKRTAHEAVALAATEQLATRRALHADYVHSISNRGTFIHMVYSGVNSVYTVGLGSLA
jgi:hypothetical protein